MTDSVIGFAEIAADLKHESDGYRAKIPDGWKQGRTAYGGIMSGLALAAINRDFESLPPLRSLLCNFIGPVIGAPIFKPTLLRQGRNVTSIGVDAVSEKGLSTRLQFIFGQNRESAVHRQADQLNALNAPAHYPDFIPERAGQFVPGFFHRFETKLISGARPMTGASEGRIACFSRHKDPASRQGIESLVALGDVLPPAAAPLMRGPGAISSMTWQLNLLTDNPVTEDGWWYVDTVLSAASAGYSSQFMTIHNLGGERVAEGMQCVAIFDGP